MGNMMRSYVPPKGNKLGVFVAKKGVTATAKAMNVSVSAVRSWLKADKIPYGRIGKLAEVLDEDIITLLPLGDRFSTETKRLQKTHECLVTLEKAYKGEPFEIKPPLTARSLALTLKFYGDRVPLVVKTLNELHDGVINVRQASEVLGVSVVTVHGLRARYGLAPGPIKKVVRPPGRYKQNTKHHREMSLKVISGRMSAVDAVKQYGGSIRSLHRHVKADLVDYGLNELSHWPSSFRLALAHEIEHEDERLVFQWVKKCKAQGWSMRNTTLPAPVMDWRLATTKRMLISILLGELSIKDLAAARGGEPAILVKLFDMELAHLGLTFSKVSSLSTFHQMAVSDMLLMTGIR